jgi:hypothetical protein
MRWCRYVLVSAVLLGASLPAPAGIFARRKKPDPVQRVPELVQILKTDRDDRKRIDAAEELRQYDSGQHPQIVPALIEALQSDPKPGVRSEAAHTLGKIRPVNQPAGQALERAASQDHALRVRLQARTALMFYHMAGYSSKKGEPPAAPGGNPATKEPPLPAGATTAEPPLAAPPPPAATPPPPAPVPVSAPPSAPSLYRPLPSNLVAPPTAVPLAAPPEEGPVLGPPR